jgi:hypothetical protein
MADVLTIPHALKMVVACAADGVAIFFWDSWMIDWCADAGGWWRIPIAIPLMIIVPAALVVLTLWFFKL